MGITYGSRRGFSLVELVIVVVILGIIAAIAIPRISSSSQNASQTALRADLQTLRNAIDWYYSEHNNTFPGVKAAGGTFGAAGTSDAFKNQLTLYTKPDGTVSADKDVLFPHGPYIRGDFPALKVGTNTGDADVTMVADAGALTGVEGDGTGWRFSTMTGIIIANTSETGSDGTSYDSF